MESEHRHASSSRTSEGSGKEIDEGRIDTARPEVKKLRRDIESLKGRIGRRDATIERLKSTDVIKGYEDRGNRIKELEHELGFYQEDARRRAQHMLAMEERLERTEALLATRSVELAGAQAFLSTTDRLSEEEVLGIVRDLNENIYQIAVDLTEEWEKLEPSTTTTPMDVDSTSRPCAPAPIQLACNRDPVRLTFLLQSRLCSQVASITSSWGHQEELAVLDSVYESLSASGERYCRRQAICSSHIIEEQAISARWRSLAHSHLSRSPPRPSLLGRELANVLGQTGSFPSTRHSLDFVRKVAHEGIETIIRHAQRLESAFMVEVTSSDMSLLSEAPGTEFDDERMTNEFGSDGAPTPGRQGRIVGTTEVGVGKSVGGAGKSRRREILLKPKVVLEKDIMVGS